MTTFTVQDLEAIIASRAAGNAENSYTRKLLDRGVEQCAKKFGEEAVEAVIAAMQSDNGLFAAECADVIYHLLVLMRAKNLSLDEVTAVLKQRTVMSGLEEKASRKTAT
jgi:phosphoribosyl-ATP pyrophosphohydrolase